MGCGFSQICINYQYRGTQLGERNCGVHNGGGLPFAGLAAEYDRHDGLGLAELIAKKQISPLELLQAVRARVERLNPKVNAFCQLFFEKAELQIKQGLPPGPFRGVPFALKDLGQTWPGR